MDDQLYVQSLEQFVGHVQSRMEQRRWAKSTTGFWFRGQADCDWQLLPAMYRKGIGDQYEREVARDFILKSKAYLSHVPTDMIEWLFLMQHHGAPTRLLDWSENPLVALFFAVHDKATTCDGLVVMMHPWDLNLMTHNLRSVPTEKSPIVKDHIIDPFSAQVEKMVGAEFPIAIRSSYRFMRAHSQSGCATIHGYDMRCLIALAEARECPGIFDLIRIRPEDKARIRRQLSDFGIHEEKLFPDLEGIARYLHYRYSPDY